MTPEQAQILIDRCARNRRTALEGGNTVVTIASPSLAAPRVHPRAGTIARIAELRMVEMMRPRHPDAPPTPERDQQVVFAAWMREQPAFSNKWAHIPNEHASKAEAGRLIDDGMESGVPDVMIFRRTLRRAPGVAIELKRPSLKPKRNPAKLRGLSESQTAWGLSLMEEGWIWGVCYSAEEAAELVIYEYCIGGQP